MQQLIELQYIILFLKHGYLLVFLLPDKTLSLSVFEFYQSLRRGIPENQFL